jgi:hypothetical protein
MTGEEIEDHNKPDYEISKLDEIFEIISELNKKFYIGKV